MTDIFKIAAEQVSANLESNRAEEDEIKLRAFENSQGGGRMASAIRSVASGAMKAGFETKDFLFGEPLESEKSDFRRDMESFDRALDNRSIGYGLTSGISQFAVGLIGAGKIMAPIKGVQKAGKAGKAAFEVGRGAVAGAVVIDPHEERLSDLIESFPALENPVTEYLAADPSDTDAEGRFKNALEGIGLDLAVVGIFAMSLKALKLAKGGDQEGARATFKQIEQARKRNAEAFGLPEDGGARFDVDEPPVEGAGGSTIRATPETAPAASPEPVAATSESPTGVPDPEAPPPQVEAVQTNSAAGPKKGKKAQPIPETEFDFEHLAKSVSEDVDAISRYGSREAAREAGHKFSLKVRLPWQKLNTTEERKVFMEAALAQARKHFDAKKGGDVLSDARVNRVVSQIAEVFNEDPSMLAGMLSEAGDQAREMLPRMEAAFVVGQKMFQDAYDVQFRIENGMLEEWGGSLAVAQAELKSRIITATELTASANSILSSSARSLRRARADFKLTQEDLSHLSSLDAETLSRLVARTKGDPKKLVRLSSRTLAEQMSDGAVSLLANNLLWMWPTHLVNVTTNVMMMVGRPTEKLIGGFVLRNSVARKQALKEYTYLTSSLSDSWRIAMDAFLTGNSQLKPFGDEFLETTRAVGGDVRAGWQPANSVWNITSNSLRAAGLVIGLPTRGLGTVDEFIKQMRYRAVVQAQAAVEATEKGLKGVEYRKHIEAKLLESFDAEGRGTNAAAVREAQTATFQNELDYDTWGFGNFGATVRTARTNFRPLGLILPFVKTPVNVLRYAVKLTPGLSLLQKEYTWALMGKAGKEAQAHAVGQFALGSIFMGLAASLALESRITGGGPANDALKKEMMSQGWRPYSYVIHNEDGSKTYVPIGRFDPAGLVFGMIADLVDIRYLHPDRVEESQRGMAAVAVALAKNFGDKAFLLNLNSALRAATDPERNLERFTGSLAGNLIPGSSAIRGYINPDPYLREARGIVDNAMRDMPGYSESLPPQRDVYGELVWRRRGLTTSQESDLVEEEHQRIIEETGKGIGRVSPNRDGVDLRDITLENGRNAYDVLQEYAGDGLKESLAKVIQSDNYQLLVDGDAETKGTKLSVLADVVSKFRTRAFKRLKAESPLLRAQLMKRQLDVRAELLSKRSETRGQQEPGARELIYRAMNRRAGK
ncbi:MAG: hypothetical protein Rhirs2KO_11300 [Rhizobiaceae bacterium]